MPFHLAFRIRALSAVPVFAALCLFAVAGRARAEECLVDEDCSSGECQHDETDAPCGSDGECPAPEPSMGTCARDVSCDSDADCPTGATCQKSEYQQCATSRALPASADGGVDGENPAPEEESSCTTEMHSECVYELVECSDDSDCSGSDVCTAIGERSDCGGASGGDPGAACAPGQECPQPPAADPEPECVETTLDYCFPQRHDCTSDTDCEDDERCVELIEDFEEDPPAGWEGATHACFVEALALALEGEIEIDGPGGSGSDESSDARGNELSAGGSSKGSGTPSGSGSDSDVESAADPASAPPTGSDGCAVATPGSDPPFAPWMLLGLALVALTRRKRA